MTTNHGHLLGSPLDEIVKRVLAVCQPRQIVLFGSAARGQMGPRSDYDLLVVVPSTEHRRKTAQKIYGGMIGVGAAVDVVVVHEEDLRLYRDHPAMVIKPALDEGKVLYAA